MFRRVLAILLLATGCATPPTGPFVGEIRLRIHGAQDDPPRERTWLVRGPRWRQAWETSRPGTWGLYDASTGAMTIVSPSDKTFTPLQKTWADGPGYLAGAFHKVTITDRTETIAGHRCRVVLYDTVENEQREECVTTELGELGALPAVEFLGTREGREAEGLAAFRSTFGARAFALRTATIRGGVRTVDEEVVEVVAREVPEEMFVVPEGYTEQKADLGSQYKP